MGRTSTRSFPGRQSQRRKTSWSNGPGQVGLQTAITASVATLVNLGQSSLADGITLVRVRGQLLLFLENSSVGAGGFTGAFGIGVGLTAGFLAGAGSLPSPITDRSWDGWMYWNAFQVVSASILDGGAASDRDQVSGHTASHRVDVDTKSMRKLNSDQTVYGALEVVEIGTATLQWGFDSRMLVKLA